MHVGIHIYFRKLYLWFITHVGIKQIDEMSNAVVVQQYEVELPNGYVTKGTLGVHGTAKIKGFNPVNLRCVFQI